jgi:pimeloyl-ACP methyl ester carboxylesterase
VHFGESFSAIIRKPESWQNTDAWEILEKYTGKILILSAGKDTIIPAEVITSIYNHSPNATYREIMHIPNAPHRLASYLQENQGQLELVVEKVVSILK